MQKLLLLDHTTNIAFPASLYPICVRSEALRASLRVARRTLGRLTGQSTTIKQANKPATLSKQFLFFREKETLNGGCITISVS